MKRQEILMLFQYDAWSTAKILETTGKVTVEQFAAAAPFPHGSLRATLVHALYAKTLWRHRWEGHQMAGMKAEDFPTVEALRERWAYEDSKLTAFVANVTEEGLERSFHYVSTEGLPHDRLVWESMLHLVNHGTQHKSEAGAMLTSMGHSPGDIDLIVYLNQFRPILGPR